MNKPSSQADRSPLYEQLAATDKRGYARFHVPGHKARATSGGGAEALAQEDAYLRDLLKIDMTEIPGLDDLHHPEGAIREAQGLAAECFGAEETFFLVGGSTAGNLAMILTVCGRGDLLLMQRNVHKSAIHACMLAGCRVVFLPPGWDADSGLAAGVAPEAVSAAIQRYPEAKAVFLTNPNYFGMGGDLAALARAAHEGGIPLLVDEAHGAHYGFHRGVPASAMQSGADAAVQSTHKMLTSLTMGAMLHVQGPRLDRDLLRQRLAMVQSSSPSYPIMASLDLSRRLMQTRGPALLEDALHRVTQFRERLAADTGGAYKLLGPAPTPAYETLDPFKLAVRAADGSALSGFQLLDELERHGCVAEMADAQHVLLACSLLTSEEDLARALQAFRSIAEARQLHDVDDRPSSPIPLLAETLAFSSAEPVTFDLQSSASREAATAVPLEQAVGRVSAEMVTPYPPGIPLLYPGESISQQTVQTLQQLAALGARFQGAADPRLHTMLTRKKQEKHPFA
ncbi:aminotransferase class I/II-fold pyridoxal phosphate-dependent enzyme [Paenibacillus koleovorans]|uniref:aminotransferase class I/II-fold pyridoxal phosphate-dependent enzyme n=1 Tax=Paenibacillus koleovorans TaxID=121608 RepID=UPI000FD9992C|nr:aminotransferase class I/II-fold pyridoxal phosphate-dependent enzyme [Paenibacillus koleovorans]